MTQPGDSQAAPPPRRDDLDDEISLLELVNVLLRRWRLVVGLPLGAAFLTAVVSFLIPPTYTATTAFVPEVSAQRRLLAGLTGLTGQFGISLGGEASQSPRFYAEVLKSRELMDRVLLSRFADPRSEHNPPDSATLLRLLDVDGESLGDSLHRGRKKLKGQLAVRVDERTGIVQLSVDSRHPALAAAVANVFVKYLNEFNAQTRQSQASERRKFIEGRITEAEQELRRAEEDLRAFYDRNRRWQESPQLVVEEDRRRRQVQIRQELYLTLKREYETARIEEVNDTPVITVVDPAVPPQEKSKPRRRLLVVLMIVLGGIVGVVCAFGAEHVERAQREEDGEYLEFRSLVSRMGGGVRKLMRPRDRQA